MQKFRIRILDNIAAEGLALLDTASYHTGGAADTAFDAIVLRSSDLHRQTLPASIQAIARAGAGTNNIPVGQLSQRGIPVFNAPGANANAVKELVLTAMLMSARQVPAALQFVASLSPDDTNLARKVEQGKKQFAGVELAGRSLGVIGLGRIGCLVADAAIALGMRVTGYDPAITVDAAWSLPAQVRRATEINELLQTSDFVTLHVPLLDETRGLIDESRLAQLPGNAVLINFSRAPIVDEPALLAALEGNKLSGYVCDFPTAASLGHPRVTALPHLGASTAEAERNCALMVIDQLKDYLEHGNIVNAVNFPSVVMARDSAYRIGIANANVPNMLGQISTAMARADLNIRNMINKSRGEMAYTLVDTDSPVPAQVIEELSAIEGVLCVRYLVDDG